MKVLERKLYQERELPELGIAVCQAVCIHLSYTQSRERLQAPPAVLVSTILIPPWVSCELTMSCQVISDPR